MSTPTIPTVPGPSYRYRAQLRSVHDGDTCTLRVDLGFDVNILVNVRVLGTNAPELATPEGKVAQQAALGWLVGAGPGEWPLVIASEKTLRPITPDKFGGRWDALIWRQSDGAELGASLIAAGQAAPWNGQGTKPLPNKGAPA